MKKILFPRICLPLIVCGSALLNNAILLAVIVLIFTFLGHYPSVQFLWMPLIMAITMALGLGIGLTLGVLNVFIRDIGQIVPILLQFGFWFTPIVYPVSIIPDPYRGWLAFSPVYQVVTATQSVLVFRSPPGWTGLLVTGGACIVLLGFALWLFRRASPEMVDVL